MNTWYIVELNLGLKKPNITEPKIFIILKKKNNIVHLYYFNNC